MYANTKGSDQTARMHRLARDFAVRISAKYTAKNIRRFDGKINGNHSLVHFPLFLQAPVNIFRNRAQYGNKGLVFFGHIALQPYKGIFECCRFT